MRRYLLTFTCLLLSISPLWAQWQSIGSGFTQSNRTVFSLSTVDAQTAWAIALPPILSPAYRYIRTQDGGQSWQEGSLPDTIGNFAPIHVFALDDSIAWISMVNVPLQNQVRIFKTTDGGASWTSQPGGFTLPGFATGTLHFFNEQEGISFGSPGTGNPSVDSLRIYRTQDGGSSWSRIPAASLPTPLAGEGVWIYSGNGLYDSRGDTLWFATRSGRVFRTLDKGQTWAAFGTGLVGNSGAPGVSSLAFENAHVGIAVSFSSRQAVKTLDGGATWAPIAIPASLDFGAIEHIPGTDNNYLLHDGFSLSTTFLVSRDGGDSWETASFPASMESIRFLSPTVGFAGGLVDPANDVGMYKWTGDLADIICGNTPEVQQIGDTLFVLNDSAASYQWLACDVDSVALPGETASRFVPKGSGNFAAVVTSANGCVDTSICFLACLAPTTEIEVEGNMLVAPPNGTVYQWVDCNDNSPIADATQSTFTPASDGNYALWITNSVGCVDTLPCVAFTQTTHLSAFAQAPIRLFPNPASTHITLEIPEQFQSQVLSLELIDVKGRLLQSKGRHSEERIDWELSSLGTGVYFLRVQTEEEVRTLRFFKQ